MTTAYNDKMPTANCTFAIGGFLCSADSLVVAESFVLRFNISGKIPPIANLQTVTSNPNRPPVRP